MHWVDILIGGCCLAGFGLGITGRGLIHLSFWFAAAVAAMGVGYISADEVVTAGLAENLWVAFAAVSVAVFALLAVLWKLIRALPFAGGALKITDALATAFVLSAGAFLAVSVLNGKIDEVNTQNSVLYPEAEALWRKGVGKTALIRGSESK
ncbi:hypothetical protein [Candidatus Mycalebacterium sp.]